MNPTPDGKMPGESRSTPREIQAYLGRISGPLLDRIDLHVEVPAVKFRDIAGEQTGETSAQVRERVAVARKRQQERFGSKPKTTCNARMGSREIKQLCALDGSTTAQHYQSERRASTSRVFRITRLRSGWRCARFPGRFALSAR